MKITINEMYHECFKNDEIGKEYSRKQIIQKMQAMFNINESSILPSDVCYNSSNKSIEDNGKNRYFIKVRKGIYKYVGLEYKSEEINPYEYGTISGNNSLTKEVQLVTDKETDDEIISTDSFDKEEAPLIISMDDDALHEVVTRKATCKPIEKQVTSKEYVRDPYVTEFAKRRANGKCQLCGNPAPFLDKYKRPYLEVHHVVWLSQGGDDSVNNTVALCPNCHKRMHILNDKNDVNYLMNL